MQRICVDGCAECMNDVHTCKCMNVCAYMYTHECMKHMNVSDDQTFRPVAGSSTVHLAVPPSCSMCLHKSKQNHECT